MHPFIKRLLPDSYVQKRYARAGGSFGNAVSYLYMGKCVGFDELLETWAEWELEYARRGYRTISFDDFVSHGGYDRPLKGLGIKREVNEPPVPYSLFAIKEFMGEIKPAIDLDALMKGQTQVGTYEVPSIPEQRPSNNDS